MLKRFIRKLSLFVNPPKEGDIYFGDPIWFIISRPIELILHNLKDKFGTNLYDPIPSKGCFKLTVIYCGDKNYILESKVLCSNKFTDTKMWMQRTQQRRMTKEMFEELIFDGMLWREK